MLGSCDNYTHRVAIPFYTLLAEFLRNSNQQVRFLHTHEIIFGFGGGFKDPLRVLRIPKCAKCYFSCPSQDLVLVALGRPRRPRTLGGVVANPV